MNYHISTENKFINYHINDVIELNEIHNNKFIILEEEENAKNINLKDQCIFIGADIINIKLYITEHIKKKDIIIVHWYDFKIAEILYNLPNKIVAVLHGGEFYQFPKWYHYKWVYGKQTKKIVRKLNAPKIEINSKLLTLSKNIYRRILFNIKIPKQYDLYNHRLKQIQRLNYILIHNSYFEIEAELIRKLYPNTKFNTLYMSYGANSFNTCKKSPQKFQDKISINSNLNILVGNSTNTSNNHLEVFSLIKKIKNLNIHCFLSYGARNTYKNLIINKGKKIFCKRFFPLLKFLSMDEYTIYINKMDIIVMNHYRQQAKAAIFTGLSLGKPIFLSKKNPLFQIFTDIGINIYNIDDINKIDLNNIIKIEANSRKKNINILEKIISKKSRQQHLKNTLNTLKEL